MTKLRLEGSSERSTHYLFRYPAKFHPPVVKALIERYTTPGDLILDPFCGSGTLLVEALIAGRRSIGIDVDPVAVAVTQAKIHRYSKAPLKRTLDLVLEAVRVHRRTVEQYQAFMWSDLSDTAYAAELASVEGWVPAIPRLEHWFRRYVVIDLARIRRAIDTALVPSTHAMFLRIVFASIIRNASNADPVPVSGLEVTSYMKNRDEAGRLVNPFDAFERAANKALAAADALSTATKTTRAARVHLGDATTLSMSVRSQVDAVITSPPYHNAVDYYRRHQLETFWMGLVESQEDRLKLLPTYLGRPKIPQSHPFVAEGSLDGALAARWYAKMKKVSSERANDLKHYLIGMGKFFEQLEEMTAAGAPVLLVVGQSSWNGAEIPTRRLFKEIAHPAFRLEEILWYPVVNRYMSYSRHNGADISKEYVMVLRRE